MAWFAGRFGSGEGETRENGLGGRAMDSPKGDRKGTFRNRREELFGDEGQRLRNRRKSQFRIRPCRPPGDHTCYTGEPGGKNQGHHFEWCAHWEPGGRSDCSPARRGISTNSGRKRDLTLEKWRSSK